MLRTVLRSLARTMDNADLLSVSIFLSCLIKHSFSCLEWVGYPIIDGACCFALFIDLIQHLTTFLFNVYICNIAITCYFDADCGQRPCFKNLYKSQGYP
jgi:hypothetical protein